MTRRRRQPLSRIWARGRRDSETGCFVGPTDKPLMVLVEGRLDRIYRVAWRLSRRRPVPRGRPISHDCDRPSCFEPRHLKLSTPARNAREASERGRLRRGERHWNARLTDDAVRDMRRDYVPGRVRIVDLAREHGIARTTAGSAIRGATWAHVDRVAA
jgi:hypothetical protein